MLSVREGYTVVLVSRIAEQEVKLAEALAHVESFRNESRFQRERAEAAELKLADIEDDAARFDFAENNPEIVKQFIENYWRTCGPGYREEWFNFRAAIDAAIEEKKTQKAKRS